MSKLAQSKADRIEIMSMQEALVKIEATFQKVSGVMKLAESQKDMFSREEIENRLGGKVDKAEYKEEMHKLIRVVKHGKKAALMAGGIDDLGFGGGMGMGGIGGNSSGISYGGNGGGMLLSASQPTLHSHQGMSDSFALNPVYAQPLLPQLPHDPQQEPQQVAGDGMPTGAGAGMFPPIQPQLPVHFQVPSNPYILF